MASDDKPAHLSLLADNVLKIVIAGLVSILTWIGTGLQKQVSELEQAVTAMQITVAEIKTDLKHFKIP